MRSRLLAAPVVAAATLMLASVGSHAFVLENTASCNGGTANFISNSDVTDNGTGNADACYGAYEGNNNDNPDGSGKEILEFEGQIWNLIGSTEEAINDLTAGDGEWAYTGTVNPDWTSYWLVIKQSNDPGHAGWYFDVTDETAFAGTYLVAWGSNGQGGPTLDYSHMELYAQVGNGVEVPEPGTLSLLGLGVAGLAFGRRRRADS